MRLQIQWKGFREAQQSIAGLGEFVSREVLLKALKATAQPLAEEMSSRCPRDTGLTAEDFGVAETRDSKSGEEVAVRAGAHSGKGGRAFIAYWLEVGIPSREIAARPFIRPAGDAAASHHVERMMPELRKAYERTVNKFAKKARSAAA